MNDLIITRDIDENQWNEFVYHHPHGSIYHLSLWRQVIEQSFRHISGKYLVAIDRASNHILAGLPVFKVKSWLLGNRLVSAPFALVCDPLATDTSVLLQLTDSARQLYEKHQVNYFEIRSSGSLAPEMARPFNGLDANVMHEVDVTVDPGNLYRSFHKKSVRGVIAKAKRAGLQIRIGNEPRDLEIFYKILCFTRRRKALPALPFKFFKALWFTMQPNGLLTIMFATHKGRVIGGLLLLEYKTTLIAEYGCDLVEYRKIGVNQFLDWEAIQYAQSKGMKKYNFGRTAKSNHGLIRYKQNWASKTIPLTTYYYPPEHVDKGGMDSTSFKYKMAQMVFKHATPGLSRILGNMLYRHMG